jgi:hypothetical protein
VTSLLFLLTTLAAAPTEPSALVVDEVFSCGFDNRPGRVVDEDYDGWPDGWTRQRSLQLPEFLRVGIVAEGQTIRASAAEPAAAETNRVLRMELDGGGVAVSGPALPVSSRFSLLLSLRIKTQGLKHDGAWATLEFFDADGKVVQSIASLPVTGTTEWQRVEIGPIAPDNNKAVRQVITLHLGPRGAEQDLAGSAEFDDIQMVRLPRMTLVANRQPGLYVDPAIPELTCEVSGVRIVEPLVHFELLDYQGQVLAKHDSPLADIASGRPTTADSTRPAEGYAGRTTWKPPLPGYGFYRVTASLRAPGSPENPLRRAQTLAVLRPFPAHSKSEFGWSLPGHEQPYDYGSLAALLGQAGLGWAKLPVWFDPRQTSEVERIAWFAEQLSIQGIELVGVLDQPPGELRQIFREQGRLPVASVFIEPELWEPVVSPVMTRLSLRVRWWQLGEDQDTSFVGYPQVESKIAEIKRGLEQFGQEVRLGIGWRWVHPAPTGKDGHVPWTFLSYNSEPSLTPAELATYLPLRATSAASEAAEDRARAGSTRSNPTPVARQAATQRWVMLSPLSNAEYDARTRIQDLVERMLATRIHGADAVFVPRPFDPQVGLMNPDGSPSELFVPWRTTASLIGGSQYLGPIELPGGSICHAFGREEQAVLVIWNKHPTTERLSLDGGVQQIDVWGRNLLPPTGSPGELTIREVAVGVLPTFLTGQSTAAALWQATLAFDHLRIASVLRVEQNLGMRVRNPFGQVAGGELTLHVPPSWGMDPRPVRFKVAADEELRLALPVTLLTDADSGPQPVRLDFEIAADRTYKFSVYRTLQLGLEDLQIELKSRLRDDGALVVEQQLTNTSDGPVSFQCLLFPPDRRREIRQVINAGPGIATATFILPRGEELIGQRLWLRAEEIGGQRVLNCSVTAER